MFVNARAGSRDVRAERVGSQFAGFVDRTACTLRTPAGVLLYLVRNPQECVSLNTGEAFLDHDGYEHLQSVDLDFCNEAHLRLDVCSLAFIRHTTAEQIAEATCVRAAIKNRAF